MLLIRNIAIVIVTFLSIKTFSQDIQYSQFYANALYMSPAFAGSNQNSRAILHSRLQWPGLDATYIGSTFSFDHYFPRYKSGVGILLNSDYQNAYSGNAFRTLDLGLQYAYQVDISENWTFRPGLQITLGNRRFVPLAPYGDQMNNTVGQIPGTATSDPTFSGSPSFSFPDVSAGGLLFSKKFWIGLSTHHLNRASQNYFIGSDRLAIKTTLHTGMKFVLKDDYIKRYGFNDYERETSFSPSLIFKNQGKFSQLDLGSYLRYNYLVAGLWYRGIPFKIYPGEKQNNEAVILLLGIIWHGFNVGYSYDFTISKLAPARTGGAHELSITYNFLIETSLKKKPPRKARKVQCPSF